MCPVIITGRFFIALFSPLEQTPCVSRAFYHRTLTWHKVIMHSFFKLWLNTQNHTGTKRVNAKMTNSSKTRRRARKKNWKQRTRLTQAKRKKTQQIKHWTVHSRQTPTHTHTHTNHMLTRDKMFTWLPRRRRAWLRLGVLWLWRCIFDRAAGGGACPTMGVWGARDLRLGAKRLLVLLDTENRGSLLITLSSTFCCGAAEAFVFFLMN